MIFSLFALLIVSVHSLSDKTFNNTKLPLDARQYILDSPEERAVLFKGVVYSGGHLKKNGGRVFDYEKQQIVTRSCPDTSGSRKVSYSDLRNAAEFAYENAGDGDFEGWEELDHIDDDWLDSTYSRGFDRDDSSRPF